MNGTWVAHTSTSIAEQSRGPEAAWPAVMACAEVVPELTRRGGGKVSASWIRTGASPSCRRAYGPGVVGGAELSLGEAAHGLAARGWSVEVLTTCAVDHFTLGQRVAGRHRGRRRRHRAAVPGGERHLGSRPCPRRSARPAGRDADHRRAGTMDERRAALARAVPPPARPRRDLPGDRRVALPVLDDVRRRPDRSGPHDRAAVPARRAARPLRVVPAAGERRGRALVLHRAGARARRRAVPPAGAHRDHRRRRAGPRALRP